MSRAKNKVASRQRRKKLLKQAKGYWGARKNLYKTAKEAVEKGWLYAYRDRKARKREFRKLWITRINAAARLAGINYSQFIYGLDKLNIRINRKMLADLAVHDLSAFKVLAEKVKNTL